MVARVAGSATQPRPNSRRSRPTGRRPAPAGQDQHGDLTPVAYLQTRADKPRRPSIMLEQLFDL